MIRKGVQAAMPTMLETSCDPVNLGTEGSTPSPSAEIGMLANERYFLCHWCGHPQTVMLSGDPTGETFGKFLCQACKQQVIVLVWNDKIVATTKQLDPKKAMCH